jgi:hypothetical protein
MYYAVDWVNRTPYCQKMLGKGSCDGPCCTR